MSDRNDGSNEQPDLPPPFQAMLEQLKEDRKKLLRDKAFTDPVQLRGFMAQYMFARLHDIVQLMGLALYDTYGLSVSNANQLKRLHVMVNRELRKLGADVDEEAELPGAGTETLDDLQQSFYSLGTLLQKKLPEDTEVQEAYNRCAQALSDLTADLMGYEPEDDEGEDEADDEGEDEGDEEESEASDEAQPSKKPESSKKPEEKSEGAKEGG